MGSAASTNRFWLSPELAEWSSSAGSSLTIIKGSYAVRLALQDFCVDLIESLNYSSIPVIWALKVVHKRKNGSMFTTVDLLKFLTVQVLRLNGAIKTEKHVTIQSSQFHAARSTQEHFDLFESVIRQVKGQLYLIIDMAAIHINPEDSQNFNLMGALGHMLRSSDFAMPANVKVMVLTYTPDSCSLLAGVVSDIIVRANAGRQKRSQASERRRHVSTRVIRMSRQRASLRA
jgi:hypothetical protein